MSLKPKKYVFHLNADNARYFESLDQDERHALINQIIEKHYSRKIPVTQNKVIRQYLKYIAIAFAVIVIVIPSLLWILKTSFTSTKANYDYFTQGFVKYEQSQRNKR